MALVYLLVAVGARAWMQQSLSFGAFSLGEMKCSLSECCLPVYGCVLDSTCREAILPFGYSLDQSHCRRSLRTLHISVVTACVLRRFRVHACTRFALPHVLHSECGPHGG